MKRVLLTSFEPFGGVPLNSSLEVGRALTQSPPPGVALEWLTLPVVAGECVERTWSALGAPPPSLVLALGQAGSSPLVRLEDRAVNFDHFGFADNAGNLRVGQAVVPGAPAVYRSNVAVARVLAGLRLAGLPVEHSYSAGSYVCNHHYFHLLHRVSQAGLDTRVLFVHLPLLPQQLPPTARPTRLHARPLEEQVNCVREVLLACLG